MKKHLPWLTITIFFVAIIAISLYCVSVNYSPARVAKRYYTNLLANHTGTCYKTYHLPERYKDTSKAEILSIFDLLKPKETTVMENVKTTVSSDVAWYDVDKMYNSEAEFEKEKPRYKAVTISYNNQGDKDKTPFSQRILVYRTNDILGFIPKYKAADRLVSEYLYVSSRTVKTEKNETKKK